MGAAVSPVTPVTPTAVRPGGAHPRTSVEYFRQDEGREGRHD